LLTATSSNAARTLTCWADAVTFWTGTRMLTSAMLVSGSFGSFVATCGSRITAAPVDRSRTWFQMPEARSRTAGIQSQPAIDR
jgi:hypothetical protein